MEPFNGKLALVFWSKERSFSRVELINIKYDFLGADLLECIGLTVEAKWDDGNYYEAEIKEIGTISELDEAEKKLELELAELSMYERRERTKQYALVQWMSDHHFSVISLSKLVFEGSLYDQDSVIGNTIKAKWAKGTILEANVKCIGSKNEMNEQLPFWVKTVSKSNLKKKTAASTDVVLAKKSKPNSSNLISASANDVEPNVNTINQSLGNENILMDLNVQVGTNDENDLTTENRVDVDDPNKKLIMELQEKLAKSEAKNRKLSRIVSRKGVVDNNEEVNIGGDIKIKKSTVDFAVNAYQRTPSLFFRHLLWEGGVFTLEEVANSSVKGKKTVMSPINPRPPLDPVKFKWLRDYTITTCGVTKAEETILDKVLSNICSDARRKIKKAARDPVIQPDALNN